MGKHDVSIKYKCKNGLSMGLSTGGFVDDSAMVKEFASALFTICNFTNTSFADALKTLTDEFSQLSCMFARNKSNV